MSGAPKPLHCPHAQSDSISLASFPIPGNDCCLYKGEANKEKARVSRQDSIPPRCAEEKSNTKQ